MKKLKEIFVITSVLICAAFSMFPVVGTGLKTASASVEPYSVSLLPASFADTIGDFGIDAYEVNDFTPLKNKDTGKRYDGKSWNPETKTITVGESEIKYANDSIDLSSTISAVDFGEIVSYADLNVVLWVYIDRPLAQGMTFSLKSSMSSDSISWEFTSGDIETMLSKGDQTSKMDIKLCGQADAVPYGWNKLVLPFRDGTVNGMIFDNEQAPTEFIVDTFSVVQDPNGGFENELYIYDIQLVESVYAYSQAIEKQDYSNIVHNDAESYFTDETYYKGEYLTAFPTISEFFISCWIGEENYLTKSASELRTYFVIQVSDGSPNSITAYNYGASDLKLESLSYTIHFSMYYFGTGSKRTIALDSATIEVDSYGDGAYFTTNSVSVEKGKSYSIRYKIHEAFTITDYSLNIVPTDETKIKIVEWNKEEQYIVVEGLEVGETSLKITLHSDRFNNTDYIDGLTNENCVVTVTKPSSTFKTTEVLLWVFLGIAFVTMIWTIVKSIIDSRKIEVK